MWYEDLLLDELTVKGYEDYVVRVMVPVYGRKRWGPHIDKQGD